MAGTLAELLTSRGDQAIALWIADPHGPSPDQAAALIDGVAAALVTGTDEPLLRAAGLTPQTPDDQAAPAVDRAVSNLQALARAVAHVTAEAPPTEAE